MSFKDLGLAEPLLRAINDKGYETPSPIQEKCIPVVLEGKDVLASAQTGTGKTAGFSLPMLQLLSQEREKHNRPVRALILTPTRELAAQIGEELKDYSRYLHLRYTVIFGGVNQNPQVRAIKQGVDILVATPGRLLDLHTQNLLRLDNVEILVLDEADRMLDMGFQRDLNRIVDILPHKRQNLLFSATFSKEIKKLAQTYLTHPVSLSATPENTTVEKIEQRVIRVDKDRKTALTIKLIAEGDWQQVLIFTRTKHGANRLSQKLEKAKITSAAIHGNKTQNARTSALAGFKSGRIRVLVATDIAARGLDIPLLPHVINYELPNVPEDYVHRIGRTGRAGASGEAISLVGGDEVDYLTGIEKLLGEKLTRQIILGFEPQDPETAPIKKQQEQRPPRDKKPHNGPKPKHKQQNQSNAGDGAAKPKKRRDWRRRR
ncbi:MAG: DEAD/DEAH box helicase [Flavobacteriales bacterium]|nr:DEAD/DEAH box helicase [Flavobacteriales bacterium]